ncbi:ABC transporter permease [Sulfidibacter corallicola]|uniref:ABC transporter permease n=1 Tax=Sulfidibacter corallicola TaxID=2818388 RepID=A0A8A4TNN8_SULCO|nr:FtsX-like permease family protein [Sulfidibacter corallicola]QTD50511.1 ABC transporter permease [Sulfidibacter corallicola]
MTDQMTFRLAWRNLWRRPRRTLLTLSALVLTLAMLIFFGNLMSGMWDRIIRVATSSLVGQAQVHLAEYRRTQDPERFLRDRDALISALERQPQVKGASARIYAPALAAMGDRSQSVRLMGVDPEREAMVTSWKDRIWQGRYLTDDGGALIGKRLAEKLEIGVDSKLVVTVADLRTGDLNSVLLRVHGILWTQNPKVDEGSVIVTLPTAEKLAGLQNAAHEVALTWHTTGEVPPTTPSLPRDDLVFSTWQELIPGMAQAYNLQSGYLWFSFVVVFLLVALSIANTMNMSLMERHREFGILMALGTSDRQLVGGIVSEYFLLGGLGSVAGLVLGLLITLACAQTGITLTGVEVMGFALDEPLYPRTDLAFSFGQALTFWVLTPLISYWSVNRLRRMDPVEILQASM